MNEYKRMWTEAEISEIISEKTKVSVEGNEATLNEGLSVNKNGDVAVGKDLEVDGDITGNSDASISGNVTVDGNLAVAEGINLPVIKLKVADVPATFGVPTTEDGREASEAEIAWIHDNYNAAWFNLKNLGGGTDMIVNNQIFGILGGSTYSFAFKLSMSGVDFTYAVTLTNTTITIVIAGLPEE